MRIFRMLEKDLRLFLRDQRTLALIILTPIIILVILGMIFSAKTTEDSIKGVTLGICNLDEEKFGIQVPIFNIIELKSSANCERNAQIMVKRGELRGAVIIPENFTRDIYQGYGSSLTLYVDDAKSQTAIVTTDSVKAIVQDLNEKIGTAFIEEAWINLNELNDKLKVAVENLVIAKRTALQIEEKVRHYETVLENINLSEAYYYADMIEYDMAEIEHALDSLSALINQSTNHSVGTDINYTIALLDSLDIIDPAIQSMQDTYDDLCIGNETMPDCIAMADTIETMQNNSASMQDKIDEIKQSYVDVVTQAEELDSIIEKISLNRDRALNEIEKIKHVAENSTDASSLLYEQIAIVEGIKDNLTRDIRQMGETATNFTNQIIVLTDELNETTKVLDIYTSKDPINIIRPVTLKRTPTHGDKSYFEFLTPGLIALILMFIMLFISSASIVSERNNGTMARNFLAPIPIPLFIVEKTLYLLVLAVIQLALMTILCMILGVSITISIALLGVMLVMALAFINLGMFIGAISKTENTALLTSLVLGIPMLFLSGLFFPFEIMPGFIEAIGRNLPMTLSTINLERLITYSTFIDYDAIMKLVATSVVLFALTYIFIRLKPTAE